MQNSTANHVPLPPLGSFFRAEIGLIFCLFFIVGGDPPPGVNEPHYLCRLKHAVDPSYCPGDLFLESPDAHLTFVVAFSWLTSLFSLETVAWLGRIGCWLGLAWAWWRLSWTVVPKPLYASLGAALILVAIDEGNFAGEWLVRGFEAKCIAYVFVLLGLRAWIVGNWNWLWIHLGIATAWHALVGGWSILIMLAAWVIGWRREIPLRTMLGGAGLGAAISLLGIVPALLLNRGEPPEVVSQAAEIYVFERLPHHLAPLHKPATWIAERAGRHAVVVVAFVGLLWLRLGDLRADGKKLRDDPAGNIAMYAAGAMALAMIGLILELVLWNHPTQAASLLRYYWFRLTDIAVPMGLASLLGATLAARLEENSKLAAGLLLVVLMVCGQHLGAMTWQRYREPLPRAEKSITTLGDWIDVCDWCRENTPSDALFLTPRGTSTFKWRAERAEVVTYKDVPQDAAGLVEWRRRLYDVHKLAGNPSLDWSGSLGELGTPRIQELADQYQFRYVVTSTRYPLLLPVAYSNGTYVVYRIP